MNKVINRFTNIMNEFVEICEANDIWYSLDDMSLLAAARKGKSFDNSKKIQVMMTVDSYNKLQRFSKNRVVDSSKNSDIKNLVAYFVDDYRDVMSYQAFVEIRILVPTSIEKINQFKSPIKRIKNIFINRKITTRIAINDLLDKKFEGYLALRSHKQSVKKSWIQSLTKKVVELELDGFKYKVLKEYKKVLEEWNGSDYLKKEILLPFINFHSPAKQVRKSI